MEPNFVKKLNKGSSKCKAKKQSSKCDEKFIFKCDQQAAIISEKLLSFYKENELFDTVLIAGSDCVNLQGHRVVLCALSEYFLEIFRGNQTTLKGNNVVELKEIEASSLKLIIDFMYSGSIELSLKIVARILRYASFLRMKTLVDGCCELMEKNINSSNSLNWLRLANELSLPRLKIKALECTYNNFEKIFKEKEFLMLSENELKDLLFNDNPHGDFEEDVFLSMLAWINYDKLKRDHLIFQLLSMVRFPALSPKFILKNRKSVCKTVESYELICSWLEWHLSPETRSNNLLNTLKPRTTSEKLAVIRLYDENVSIETFDLIDNAWFVNSIRSLPTEKFNSAVIQVDGKLIIVGGIMNGQRTDRVECLDLQSLEWIDFPPIKNPRSSCQLADLKGYLCVFGGEEKDDISSIEIYNFSTRQWHDEEMLSHTSRKSQIAAQNGLLYILDLEYGSLQSYNVISNSWTLNSIGKSPIQDFGFVAFEDFLYVIGGCLGGIECFLIVKRYNFFNDSWCEMASLPRGFYGVHATIVKNKIIIIGYSHSVLEYNINSNKWNYMPSLSGSSRCNNTLCTIRSDLLDLLI